MGNKKLQGMASTLGYVALVSWWLFSMVIGYAFAGSILSAVGLGFLLTSNPGDPNPVDPGAMLGGLVGLAVMVSPLLAIGLAAFVFGILHRAWQRVRQPE